MKLIPFTELQSQITKQLDSMGPRLLKSKASGDQMWDTYLKSFPEGANPLYRVRSEYDCSCCRQFIKTLGGALAIKNGKLVSIWDVVVGGQFQPVVDAMSALVKGSGVQSIYYHYNSKVGTKQNRSNENGQIVTYDHFYHQLDGQIIKQKKDIARLLGESVENYEILKRSMLEISPESVEEVLALIEEDSLYRGAEYKRSLITLKDLLKEFKEAKDKEIFYWDKVQQLGNGVRIRNSVIGTLVVDLSEGKDLEAAVKAFESKVAPENYKRPKSLITPSMVKKAEVRLKELGLTAALERRHSTLQDITINNVLFADRKAQDLMSGGIFDQLITESKQDKAPKNVPKINIQDFIDNVLPTTSNIDLLLENKMENNLVSLISPIDQNGGNLFKWNNNFSWSYNGEVADSLRDRVKAAGGRVDGVLRFSHSWNHTGENQSLMDLHVFMPSVASDKIEEKYKKGACHDFYPNGSRVGWNQRNDHSSGGVQDLDYISPPGKNVLLENITFPSLKRLPRGDYFFLIHNWQARSPNQTGFKAEVELLGEVYEFEYNQPLKNKEWVMVGKAAFDGSKFKFTPYLDSTTSQKEIWGIKTGQYHRVSSMMLSPNFWDGQEIGNKHYMFMLEGCNNPDECRGFYNEFVKGELNGERKVLEVISSKLKVKPVKDQLSGVGFSSTVRSSAILKVKDQKGQQKIFEVQF